MAAGEPVVSQASTEEFREGFARVFNRPRVSARGRWIWDESIGKLVRADDYRPPVRALDDPIIADRIHEGTTIHDGDRVVDIGSRRKRRAFMRRTGVEDATDASPAWLARQKRETEARGDRATDAAFDRAARQLHNDGKLRD